MADSDFSLFGGQFPTGGFYTPGEWQDSSRAEQQETLAELDESVAEFAEGRWITSEELDRRLTARLTDLRNHTR